MREADFLALRGETVVEACSPLLRTPAILNTTTEGMGMNVSNPVRSAALVVELVESVEFVPCSEQEAADEITFYNLTLRAGTEGPVLATKRYVDTHDLSSAEFSARYRVIYDGEAYNEEGALRAFNDWVGYRMRNLFND